MRSSVIISGVTFTLTPDMEQPGVLKFDDQVVNLVSDGVSLTGIARTFAVAKGKKPNEVTVEGAITIELIACALILGGAVFKSGALKKAEEADAKLVGALVRLLACHDETCASDKTRFVFGMLTSETVQLAPPARVHVGAPARVDQPQV